MTVTDISTLYPSTVNTSGSGVSGSKTTASTDFSSVLGSAVNKLNTPHTTSLETIFAQASAKYGVPENLLKAVAKAESGFRADAVSSCGAQGIMQLMPGTAASHGVKNSFDPEQNIMGGTKLLSELLRKYNGNSELALAAYNAGSGAVDKYGGIPPYKETQNYVKRVMSYASEPISVPDTKVSTSSDSASSVASTSPYQNTINFYTLLAAQLENGALSGSNSDSSDSFNSMFGTSALSQGTSGSDYSQLLSLLTSAIGGTSGTAALSDTDSSSSGSVAAYHNTVNFYSLLAAELQNNALGSALGSSSGDLGTLLGANGLSSGTSGSTYTNLLSLLTSAAGGNVETGQAGALLSLEALSGLTSDSLQTQAGGNGVSSVTQSASSMLMNSL